ncbi:hypothetical protein FF38_08619 [Lucilia cuprina]|uniref:Uncharacterized protein n=1 Tax=Lucilia cuprina TaxID=7375 RepID=A0A0L0C501_LUCCU|nr:hypothetical protein FF38_08619 [Lucilia cuprina]
MHVAAAMTCMMIDATTTTSTTLRQAMERFSTKSPKNDYYLPYALLLRKSLSNGVVRQRTNEQDAHQLSAALLTLACVRSRSLLQNSHKLCHFNFRLNSNNLHISYIIPLNSIERTQALKLLHAEINLLKISLSFANRGQMKIRHSIYNSTLLVKVYQHNLKVHNADYYHV